METINKKKVASVALVNAKVSEDELAVYEVALSYALDTLDETELKHRFGASVDEIEGMRDDLREALTQQGETALKPEAVTNRASLPINSNSLLDATDIRWARAVQ